MTDISTGEGPVQVMGPVQEIADAIQQLSLIEGVSRGELTREELDELRRLAAFIVSRSTDVKPTSSDDLLQHAEIAATTIAAQ